MYYRNQPCEVLSQFGNKAVISLIVQDYEPYHPEDCFDPSEHPIEIIVEKKHLHDKFLDFETMFDQQRKEVEKEIKKLRDEKKKDLDVLKKEAEDLKDDMKLLKLKASKYDGLLPMLNFLNNEYKYVLIDESCLNKMKYVIDLSEAKDDGDLVVVVFRGNSRNHKKGEVVPFLSQHGNGSGRGTLISKFLKNDEEAREVIKNLHETGCLQKTKNDEQLFAKLGLEYITEKRNQEAHEEAEKAILKNVETKVKKILLYKQKLKAMGIDITDKLVDKPN